MSIETAKTRVYIAGPYTGDGILAVGTNVHRAIVVADALASWGYVPFCPQLCHAWQLQLPREKEFWMNLGAEWLRCCHAVLRFDGVSTGADLQVKVAASLKIPVYTDIEELAANVPLRQGAPKGPQDSFVRDRPDRRG